MKRRTELQRSPGDPITRGMILTAIETALLAESAYSLGDLVACSEGLVEATRGMAEATKALVREARMRAS